MKRKMKKYIWSEEGILWKKDHFVSLSCRHSASSWTSVRYACKVVIVSTLTWAPCMIFALSWPFPRFLSTWPSQIDHLSAEKEKKQWNDGPWNLSEKMMIYDCRVTFSDNFTTYFKIRKSIKYCFDIKILLFCFF